MTATELQLAALHEAAHVAAAVELRVFVREVKITPRGGGATTFLRGRVRMPRHDAILFNLAGAAAEALHLQVADLSFDEIERRCGPAREDFARARRAAGPSGELAYLRRKWSRATDLVRRRWAHVETLAAALQAEGRISGPRAMVLAGWRRP